MLTASKYSHYGLFTIPFLASIASFGIYETFKNKSTASKLTLIIFGGLILIISILFFLSPILNFNLKILNQFSLIEMLIIFILSSISIFLSFNFLFKTNLKSTNINKILSIFFIQIISLNLLFGNGTIGNPNKEFKDFIYQPDVKKITQNNQILLIGGLDDKNLYLFKFYLPKSKLIKMTEIPAIDSVYGVISDNDITQFNDSNSSKFIKLKKFKNLNFVKIN